MGLIRKKGLVTLPELQKATPDNIRAHLLDIVDNVEFTNIVVGLEERTWFFPKKQSTLILVVSGSLDEDAQCAFILNIEYKECTDGHSRWVFKGSTIDVITNEPLTKDLNIAVLGVVDPARIMTTIVSSLKTQLYKGEGGRK